MSRPPKLPIILLVAAACGPHVACLGSSGAGGGVGEPATTHFRPTHAHTLRLGSVDNVEVIQIVPGTRRAIAVGSKGRTLTMVEVTDDGLVELASTLLLPNDAGESELTHVALDPTGTWAVLTRTIVEKDTEGATRACRGSLLFVDIRSADAGGATFGEVLSEIEVGPMPDAAAISPDGAWVVSANERDVVWGKCEGADEVGPPSISIVDVREGPALAVEAQRLLITGNLEREPEALAWSADGRSVVVTIQDTHEVWTFDLDDALTAPAPHEALGLFVRLPPNAIDQDPWPDGVAGFLDGTGTQRFAVAGEANDAIVIVDEDGVVLHNLEIAPSSVPAELPRDGTWGPLFRPDSIASMKFRGRVFLAATLKASGAVGVWDVSEPERPELVVVEPVGFDEQAGSEGGSTISPEGIAASSEHGFLLTANEGESSISLLLP